jgi:hypothetical protein
MSGGIYSCTHIPADLSADAYFLSHAGSMPFMKLVNIAMSALRVIHTDTEYVQNMEHYKDISFLWIDIFCKNQHVPAPAMDEFESAM